MDLYALRSKAFRTHPVKSVKRTLFRLRPENNRWEVNGSLSTLCELIVIKGLFTPSESESGTDKRTSKTDQRLNGKHQREFLLSVRLCVISTQVH